MATDVKIVGKSNAKKSKSSNPSKPRSSSFVKPPTYGSYIESHSNISYNS